MMETVSCVSKTYGIAVSCLLYSRKPFVATFDTVPLSNLAVCRSQLLATTDKRLF